MTDGGTRRAVIGVLAAVVSMPVLAAAPATADDRAPHCPDIHVLAVQGSGQARVDAPTEQDTGELAGVIVPVLNAAEDEGYTVERTYVSYPADTGAAGVAAAYKSSVLDGYQRLAQVAGRVVYQCPDTKLIALGYAQGGQAVSMWAQQVAAGKTGQVTPDAVALAVTFGDPTRAAGAPLFASRPAQVGPGPWPGLEQGTPPSVGKFADLYVPPQGQGIGPERDIAASFGRLDGRVAQWCLPGDLSCSAPKSISLARAALGVAGQSSGDFTRDPFGVAGQLAAATANTVASGVATFADKDIRGRNLANVYFDPGASISQRLEQAADPRNADQQTDPLTAVLKMGQIVMSSVTSFLGQVFNSGTLSSLINAGVQVAASAAQGAAGNAAKGMIAGPEAAAAAAAEGAVAGAAAAAPGLVAPVVRIAGNTLTAALNIVPPQSAEKKVSSVFDLLINEVQANADLPALLLDSRLWSQTATQGGYRADRVATDGSTPADITADWIIAAGRDYHRARADSETTKNSEKASGAPSPTARYDRGPGGAVQAPVSDRPDLSAAATTDTTGDVRLFTAPPVPAQPDGSPPPAPIVWISDGPAPVADRLVAAADGDNPAAVLMRLGSPVVAATTAIAKAAPK
ncbi:cutinase family protein [Nocardia wallacei]|uniref:cutinase family protein n=1 Tax=Nocardia wallacei TaxID=480035 RepID=UPI002455096A|nr:cutinase family protein [Nocardia wallacei]